MISSFVREQKRYTQEELCSILHCSEEKIVPILRRLKEYGVLKAVKASSSQRDMSALVDEDIEVTDVEAGEDAYLYVFTFVGVITVAGRVLKCYPKYLLNSKNPREELRQVLKAVSYTHLDVYKRQGISSNLILSLYRIFNRMYIFICNTDNSYLYIYNHNKDC